MRRHRRRRPSRGAAAAAGALLGAAPSAADNCGNHVCQTFGKTHIPAPASTCCTSQFAPSVVCPSVACTDQLCCEAVSCAGVQPDYLAAHVTPLSAAALALCDTMIAPQCAANCAPGFYSPSGSYVRCTGEGQWTVMECYTSVCDVNQRVVSNTCRPCPPGLTSPAGAPTPGPDTSCTSASCGRPWLDHADANVEPIDSSFCSASISPACVLTCAVSLGYQQSPDGAPSLECEQIQASVIDWVVHNPCVPKTCSTDERVVSHQCVSCPLGHGSLHGADASGDDTECEPFQCWSGATLMHTDKYTLGILPSFPAGQANLSTGAPVDPATLQRMPKYYCGGSPSVVCHEHNATEFTISGYTCAGLPCPYPFPQAVQDALDVARATPASGPRGTRGGAVSPGHNDISPETGCGAAPDPACALACEPGNEPGDTPTRNVEGHGPLLECIEDPVIPNTPPSASWHVYNPCKQMTCKKTFTAAAFNVLPYDTAGCDGVGEGKCQLQCAVGYAAQSHRSPNLRCEEDTDIIPTAGKWVLDNPCATMCAQPGEAYVSGVVPRTPTSDLRFSDGFVIGTGLPTRMAAPSETSCFPGSGFLLRPDAELVACQPPQDEPSFVRTDCSLERCCIATCGFYICPVGHTLRPEPNTLRCPDHRPESCSMVQCCEAKRCAGNEPQVQFGVVDCSAAAAHGAECALSAVAPYTCRGGVTCTAESSEDGGYATADARGYEAVCGLGCDSVDLSSVVCGAALCDHVAHPHRLHRPGGFIDGARASAADFENARSGSLQGPLVAPADVCADGYAPSAGAVWICPELGGAATLSAQLCGAAVAGAACDTLHVAGLTTCGGFPCASVSATWSAVVYSPGGFADDTSAASALRATGLRVDDGAGLLLSGSPCSASTVPNPLARLHCHAGGGTAEVDRQLCTAPPNGCSAFDARSACGGGSCANLAPQWSSRRLVKSRGWVDGLAPSQDAFDGSLDTTGGNQAPVGAVCADGYDMFNAPPIACAVDGGDAAISGQLCGASGGRAAACTTLSVSSAASSAASPEWAGKTVYGAAGFAHRASLTPDALAGAQSVPDGAPMAAPACAASGRVNRGAVLSCAAAGGAASLDGPLCVAQRADSAALGAAEGRDLFAAWAAKRAQVAGVPVIGAASPACADHPTNRGWLRCGVTMQGSVAALPLGFGAAFRATMADVLRVALSRVLNPTFRDGSVVATFDVTCGTACPADGGTAYPTGVGGSDRVPTRSPMQGGGDEEDDDDSSSWAWWTIVIVAVLAAILLALICWFLFCRSKGGQAQRQSEERKDPLLTHHTSQHTEQHHVTDHQSYVESADRADSRVMVVDPSTEPNKENTDFSDPQPHPAPKWSQEPDEADDIQIEKLSHQIDRLETLLSPPVQPVSEQRTPPQAIERGGMDGYPAAAGAGGSSRALLSPPQRRLAAGSQRRESPRAGGYHKGPSPAGVPPGLTVTVAPQQSPYYGHGV